MNLLFTLLSPTPYINLPQDLVGWMGFIFLLGVNFFLLVRWRKYDKPWGQRQWVLFLILAVSVIPTSLFFGLQLPVGNALPPPETALEPLQPTAMLLSALPWALAAGLLGPIPAAILALFSGLLQALWKTHDIFTPLELVLLAQIFSAAVCQQYRTPVYRLLRHPMATALLLAFLYPLIFLIVTPFTTRGILVSRLDYALTHLQGAAIATGIELFFAGLFSEVVSLAAPNSWGGSGPLIPSPSERSLQTRLLYSMAPLALVLVLFLMLGNWFVAERAARGMLEARMANAANLAAENVPYFLESGQNLIAQLSNDARLNSSEAAELTTTLSQNIKTVPFFDQLFLLDENGVVLAAYPTDQNTGQQAPLDEQLGVELALNGVPYQTFTIPPATGGTTAQVTFMAAISNDNQAVDQVLIGRTNLATNPLTKPTLTSLTGVGGQGMLLDENQRILIGPDPEQVMTTYGGQTGETPLFYDDRAPDGTRQLVYYQPASGRPWSVVLTVPASRTQQLALNFATPLLGMIIVMSFLAIFILRVGLRMVTASLQTLSVEAERIAQGQLDRPLSVDGEDEVGHLRRSFEQMRVSLKARLDELNRLLLVSQGVASSLEISEAVQPVLESALGTGASSARVVLTPTVLPELDGASHSPISFGSGSSHDLYQDLDEQILAFTRQQERLVQSNVSRPRLLNFAPGAPRPESLVAVALRHENLYYGTLWVAYDQPHSFTEEEVRFLVTLGSQAALAAANARLFQNAEIGRQRLAAILASSPDPVLVTDRNDQMLLANPAAWQVLGLGQETDEGQPIEEIISHIELLDLLRSSSNGKLSKELSLPNGRVYLASATPVLAEGQRMGRVCVLRDVTHFKELDALKSEFVSTVSHDLRSPLTLMRGYATMLDMVGDLNEQQINYVRKIVTGVESMSRLVNNLLDLGRIEAGIGLQLEMIPIHDVVERVVGALQIQAAQKHIQLTYDIPEETIPLIEADQALLQQALHNLVENAVKYTRPEGKVHLRVRVQAVGMVFEVSDTGIGVSPMDQARLFEKFYRGAHQGAKEQRGSGLGLAIVKSIAERHGGSVWAESKLGEGSTFYLSIPLQQPKREARERARDFAGQDTPEKLI